MTSLAFGPYPDGWWVVEVTRLADGDELPLIRHAVTWQPAPLALRYALDARDRLGPGSLVNELRALCATYNWAAADPTVGFLEDWLATGRLPTKPQLERLERYLRFAADADSPVAGSVLPAGGAAFLPPQSEPATEVPVSTYRRRLSAALYFLDWAVEPDRLGIPEVTTEDERTAFLWRLRRHMGEWRAKRPMPESLRADPLSALDVRYIRRALGHDAAGRWSYDVFTPETRVRNWALFEMGLNYGLRAAELLLVSVADLPEDSDALKLLTVPRERGRPTPGGLRRKTPRLVEIPALDPAAYDVVARYRDEGPPHGRRAAAASPRLFVPLEVDTAGARPASRGGVSADDRTLSRARLTQIMAQIGRLAWSAAKDDAALSPKQKAVLEASLTSLHPHRLRHTWAGEVALAYYPEHGFHGVIALLKLWGGWKEDDMPAWYAQHAMNTLAQRAATERLARVTGTVPGRAIPSHALPPAAAAALASAPTDAPSGASHRPSAHPRLVSRD